MAKTIRRVVRVLIYEGSPQWMDMTLKPIAVPDGTTRHFSGGLIRATRVEDVLITATADAPESGLDLATIDIVTFEEPRT